MLPRPLLLAAALFALPAAAQTGAVAQQAASRSERPNAAADRWWAHVRELADDRYEGRLTGTPGYDRAAAYVVAQFRALGLKPAGTDGFLQPVPLLERQVDVARSSAELTGPPGVRALRLGDEAILRASSTRETVIDAPLVFIGYGLPMPTVGHDDFAGEDLRGKVLVEIGGGPAGVPPGVLADAARTGGLQAAEKAGALGVIGIPNPSAMDVPWSRQLLAAAQPAMTAADPADRTIAGPWFSLSLDPARAGQILALPDGRRLADLLAMAEKGEKLPHFAMSQRLRLKLARSERPLSSPNVVAMLPGRDPKLRGEYVVLSAHLDHVGVGAPIEGDRIYNGAMDNASGIASLIEAARGLKAKPPRRSVIFLAVTGEERGLLGSNHFARHPTVPIRQIVADINMDMFLPIHPLTHLIGHGAEESSLGAPFAAAVQAAGVTAMPDPEPNRVLFVRSDQYSFIREGVPSIFLRFGAGTPEQAGVQKAWLAKRYHAPSDDAQQPVDLAAAAKFNGILMDVIRRVADAPARPAWNADSYFRRFARPDGAIASGR